MTGEISSIALDAIGDLEKEAARAATFWTEEVDKRLAELEAAQIHRDKALLGRDTYRAALRGLNEKGVSL